GRAAPRHGAATADNGADQRDRRGAAAAARPGAERRSPCNDPSARPGARSRHRRQLRDRRAVARYAGLTGAPDETGAKRREKGLAKAGNARVRRGMIQLAWRFLLFQKDSALAQWYRVRTANGNPGARKTMIVALARKLLIALWRLVTTGDMPQGLILRNS